MVNPLPARPLIIVRTLGASSAGAADQVPLIIIGSRCRAPLRTRRQADQYPVLLAHPSPYRLFFGEPILTAHPYSTYRASAHPRVSGKLKHLSDN